MNGRITFLHCVCLTLAGVFVLALAPGLSGIPPENASARNKEQAKSAASRLVTGPSYQLSAMVNDGGVSRVDEQGLRHVGQAAKMIDFEYTKGLAGQPPLVAGAGDVSWGDNNITIPLVAGTNLISIPVSPDNPSVADMFAPLGSAFIEAHTFIADSDGGPRQWFSYSWSAPSFLNTLTDVVAASPLVVYMDAPGELVVEGQPLGAADVPVESGWSLLGYNGLSPHAPGEVFELVEDSLTEVYTLVGAEWKRYAPQDPVNIEVMRIAQAYWNLLVAANVSPP